jgi:hypothetical protein
LKNKMVESSSPKITRVAEDELAQQLSGLSVFQAGDLARQLAAAVQGGSIQS